MKAQHTAITFEKTEEEYGGFSNMSGDFPIMVNGIQVRSSEHLFQALKFTDHPDVQKQILNAPSPRRAKSIANSKDDVKKNKEGNLKKVRQDWEEIQIEVMEFCLRIKLIWHWVKFGDLLRRTEDMEIYAVEPGKTKSPFWGVIPDGNGFRGGNHLGKLLMKLRDDLILTDNKSLMVLEPPSHLGLKFLRTDISKIDRSGHLLKGGTRSSEMVAEIRP